MLTPYQEEPSLGRLWRHLAGKVSLMIFSSPAYKVLCSNVGGIHRQSKMINHPNTTSPYPTPFRGDFVAEGLPCSKFCSRSTTFAPKHRKTLRVMSQPSRVPHVLFTTKAA